MSFVLGLKPHSLTITRPKRRKHWEIPHSRWSCRKMLKGTSPRGPDSSDLTNVCQVNFTLTYVTFQEIPATKIDLR